MHMTMKTRCQDACSQGFTNEIRGGFKGRRATAEHKSYSVMPD